MKKNGSSRKVRESPSSNLLEVEGRRKALLVRRAFHGTAVTHAADNPGIIPEENVKNLKRGQNVIALSFFMKGLFHLIGTGCLFLNNKAFR